MSYSYVQPSVFYGNKRFANDVDIDGNLNVDGTSTLVGAVSVGSPKVNNDVNLIFGTTNAAATAAIMQYDTAETVDGLKLGLDETSRHFIICDYGDVNTDTTLTAATDPTLYLFAATFGTTKFNRLYHDGTNAIYNTGTGGHVFYGAGTFRGSITAAGVTIANDLGLILGQSGVAATSSIIQYDTAETVDGTKWGLDETSRHLIICDFGDINTDTTRAASLNPTLYIYAATFDVNDYASLAHDGTNLLLYTGQGKLDVNAPIIWTNVGDTITGSQYTVGRDADATNQLHFNVPTGASFEWSINDAAEITLTTASLNLKTAAAGYFNIANGSDGIGMQLRPHVTTQTATVGLAITNDPFVGAQGFSASSGTQTFIHANFIVNQTGTAGYSGLTVTATETATGSGSHYLARFIAGVAGGTTSFEIYGTHSLGRAAATGTDMHFLMGGGGQLQFRDANTLIRENSGMEFQTNGADGFKFVNSAGATGTREAFVFTSGAHTNQTASTEVVGVNFNLSATKQWATGVIAKQSEMIIQSPTYGFVGASSVTTTATIELAGSPIAGTNATIDEGIALQIGDYAGWKRTGDTFGISIAYPGITNGFGATGVKAALWIRSDNPDGSAIGLGNQTATLAILAGIYASGALAESTTLTRTITQAATVWITGPPENNGNITFTNPALSLYIATGNSRFDGNLIIGTGAAGSTANKVLALSNSATAPTTSVDLVQLYGVDLSAGNATLGIFTETAVVSETVVSDRTLTVKINGTNYKICLKV